MSTMRQLAALMRVNVAGLRARMVSSLVIVVGIASVVAVTIMIFSVATGFDQTNENSGRSDRAILLSKGAQAEVSSSIPREALAIVAPSPGIRRNAAGEPLVSADALVLVDVSMRARETNAKVPLRGLPAQGLEVRPEIRITQGRMFQPGLQEVIVGERAAQTYTGLELGGTIALGRSEWRVVGYFDSKGSNQEMELLGDAETVRAAFLGTAWQSITVVLESPEALTALSESIAQNPSLSLDVHAEPAFHARQTQAIKRIIKTLGFLIGGIMSLGAIFGAINVMYSAVRARATEIATLQAVGFEPAPVVAALLLEVILVASVGGALGAAAAWLFFNGMAISTSAGSPSQLIVPLVVTPTLVIASLVAAGVIGLIGGLFPALSAARTPIVQTLRRA